MSPRANRLRGRLGTMRAAGALTAARLLVTFAPFKRWSNTLGGWGSSGGGSLAEAQRLARQVEWAAERLPFETKCLPRSMALSWILRGKGIGHSLVLAARPEELRDSTDALHAWVEVKGTRIIGDLPGPWLEMLRLGES